MNEINVEQISTLLNQGEVKLEVTLKVVGQTPAPDNTESVAGPKPLPRPYDSNGRLKGLRQIAKYMSCSVGYLTKLISSSYVNVYQTGRTIYAYEDELREALLHIPNPSNGIKKMLQKHTKVVLKESL